MFIKPPGTQGMAKLLRVHNWLLDDANGNIKKLVLSNLTTYHRQPIFRGARSGSASESVSGAFMNQILLPPIMI